MEASNADRKMPMPFEIITPPQMPPNAYSQMRSSQPYFMPPTNSSANLAMNMLPPHSRFPPQSKSSMYPPYSIPPYYNLFGMRGDMPPGAMPRPRYDDPSMYVPCPPDYPQEYPMPHHMRSIPPHLSHLQHIQQMATMAPPYGPNIGSPQAG